MTFDGAGKYTLSNTQLFDSAGSTMGSCASLGGGTYGVQSNGIAQLDNPLYPATLFGTFSQPVVMASSTEDDGFDLFIAVQAPSASSSNGILSGDFTVGTLDFLNSSVSLARQGYFTLKADGQGNVAAFAVTGSLANVRSGADRDPERCSLHLCTFRHGGWNVNFSRQLGRIPPRSSAAPRFCTYRPTATGSWQARQPDRICSSGFAHRLGPVRIRS